MKTYVEFDEFLSSGRTARSRERRKLANNTYVERRPHNAIAVVLHRTDVVTLYSNGNVRLNSGGWRTMTTLARIREFSPVEVYTEKGVWYISERHGYEKDSEPEFPYNHVSAPFRVNPPSAAPPPHDCSNLYCHHCISHRGQVHRYEQMQILIGNYGSFEQWQTAYRESIRNVRAGRKIWRQWRNRNRVEFHDGISLDSKGRVILRPVIQGRDD